MPVNLQPLQQPKKQTTPGEDFSLLATSNQTTEQVDCQVMDSEPSALGNGTASSVADRRLELIGSIIFLVCSYVCHFFSPHIRPIPYQLLQNSGDYVRNLMFNEPYSGETVSDIWLVILGAVVPFVSQIGLSQFFTKHELDAHLTACSFSVGFGLEAIAIEAIKLYVGYLRPIFFSVCQPSQDYQYCSNPDEEAVLGARKSFPSGHASMSFCGLVMLSMFLHRRFGMPSIRRWVVAPQAVGGDQSILCCCYTSSRHSFYRMISVLSLLPVALSTFIAVSRIHDNKHFPADVVGGALLGGSIAYFTHNLYFDEHAPVVSSNLR